MNDSSLTTSARPVCVVTGGSKGIGLAIVRELLKADEHFLIYILDRQVPSIDNDSDGTIRAAMTRSDKQQLIHKSIDISNAQAFTTCLQEIAQRHQRFDVLINNAGYFETTENNNVLWDPKTNMEQIDFIMNTNCTSVVHGTRAAVQLMRTFVEPSSSSSSLTPPLKTIINIASTAALGVFPMHPVYCSTKSAVLQFTRTAQIDLDPEGFRIYAICPGIIDTEMGRMGGEPNMRAVAQLKGGKRTNPQLVGTAVADLVRQRHPKWNRASYLIVDDHEISCVGR